MIGLDPEEKRLLMEMVKPKFETYFRVTKYLVRSIPNPQGQAGYTYSDESIILDLTFLCVIFADVYEVSGKFKGLAQFLHSNPDLNKHFFRIIEGTSPKNPDGEFWRFSASRLGALPHQEALDNHLEAVLRTLRNGPTHCHWLYTNRSAIDYWNALGWDTASAPAEFRLQQRPRKNYTMFIADASPPFKPHAFWHLDDLRILTTPAHILRYHLYLFLNFVLTGRTNDIFIFP